MKNLATKSNLFEQQLSRVDFLTFELIFSANSPILEPKWAILIEKLISEVFFLLSIFFARQIVTTWSTQLEEACLVLGELLSSDKF